MNNFRILCLSTLISTFSAITAFSSNDIFTDIKTGSITNLKSYIQNGGDVNLKDENGRTLLIWAALLRDAEFVKLLIDSKADVNITQNGYSALMAATNAENTESVKLLIDAHADVNGQNKQGYTALMLAAAGGNARIVGLLLAAKADPMIKDNNGDTAYDFASSGKHSNVALMLVYPSKRLSVWNSIIPDHSTASYITEDKYNRSKQENTISMELDIGKERALQFYRDELIRAGWHLDTIFYADSESGTLINTFFWGILRVSKDSLTLTMSVLSDEYATPGKQYISIYDSTMTLVDHYEQTAATQIVVTLFNGKSRTGTLANLPEHKEILNQLNQRFTSDAWAVTIKSIANEGHSVIHKDNITGSTYSFQIKISNISLIHAKLVLEQLNGKPIKEKFLSIGVKLGDIYGNEYPAVGAGTGTAEFYDLARGGIQSIMVPMQATSDIEYVFAVPEGTYISKFIWPDMAPIGFPIISVPVIEPTNNVQNNSGTKTYDNGKYVGDLVNNIRNGQGIYTWTSGEYTGDEYTGWWANGLMNGQGTYTWANGEKYVGEWKAGSRNGQGTYIWANGNQYTGEWLNGKQHGWGEKTFSNGDKYLGEWRYDMKYGKGTYTWSDGSVYNGEWEEDVKSGTGEKTWPNGDKYIGEWKDDSRNGEGTYTWVNGVIYKGEWVDDKMKKGTCTFLDGAIYTGEWNDNVMEGKGTYVWANGDKYAGEWKNNNMYNGNKFNKEGKKIATYTNCEMQLIGKWKDVKDRKGTYQWANGDIYTGECENGIIQGTGEKTWANGDTYCGEWENGLRSGIGTYTWANGEKYDGEWKEDSKNGTGTRIWANGDKYEGEWKNGNKSGQGTYTWANGDEYIGEWKTDNRNGNGTFTWADGEKYEGEFIDDIRNGQGTYYWVNGNKYTGEWKDGQMYNGTKYNKDGEVIAKYSEGEIQ